MKNQKNRRRFRAGVRRQNGSISVPAERLEPRQLLTGSGNIVVTVTGQLSTSTVVYIDANNNGKFDAGDTALAANQSTYGTYTAVSQPYGTYTIRETVPAGYVQSTPANNAAITYVNNGTAVPANFDNEIGPQLPSLGSISGQMLGAANTTLLLDTNNMGINAHPGERTIQPDGNGNYTIVNAPVGTYNLWDQDDPNLNTVSTIGTYPQVTVAAGQAITGLDYVVVNGGGSVSGTVTGGTDGQVIYLDANSNGQLDPGEFQTTTSGGQFSFPSIPDGSYIVRQVLSGNLTQSTPSGNAGVSITVVDGSASTANFTDSVPPVTGSVTGTVTGGVTGETVFLDANNNGSIDPGEPTTTTAADGSFQFPAVPVGTYFVRQMLPNGVVQTTPGSGAGIVVDVTAGSTSTAAFVDTVVTQPGTVTGAVTGGPAGETVYLDANGNGMLDSGELSTTTGSGGAFSFAGVSVGTYTVRQILGAGYSQTSPASGAGIAITVAAGSNLTGENFTDAVIPTTGTVAGTVTGGPAGETVYLDANNNGKLDSGELSTTTGTGGVFSFPTVPVGTYVLRQVLQAGYAQTLPASSAGIGITVAGGSNLTGENFTDAVVVGSGSVAGTVTGGPAGETVYLDANNNGKLDSGELSTTTGTGGVFSFPSVPAGSYVVRQVLQVGYSQTLPASGAGIPVTVAGGSNLTGVNFTDAVVAATGTISGTVTGGPAGETLYLDANNNGQLDSGELSATTGAGGVFSFNTVPIGSYTLRQILTGGYTQAAPPAGAGIALTVAAGSALTGENFIDSAAVATGNIAIHLFNDTSGDGVEQSSEGPLNSFGTYLDLNDNHVFDGSDVRHLSDTSGNITFSTLPVGTYYLEQNVPPGYTVTTPAGGFPITVHVTAGGTASVLVGEYYGTIAVKTVPLTGTTIGTAGSYKNLGNTITKATDGSLSTFFDGPTANGNWVGLDLGATGGVAMQISFASRNGAASRMNGGTFQASDSSDFSTGTVNLYTIGAAANISSTVLTTVSISNSTAYRYYRYLSPAGSYGNIAEFQLTGTAGGLTAPVKLTGTAIGTAGSFQNLGNTIGKAVDGNLATFFDGPSANGNWVGLDLGSAQTIASIAYAPRVNFAGRMVGGEYQVSTSADFSTGVTTILTITAVPVTGTLTTVALAFPVTARYVRYLSPAGSYGNIAELQLFK